jgi:hypothetical protein
MEKNPIKRTIELIFGAIGLVLTIVGIFVTITTPEIRKFFHLDVLFQDHDNKRQDNIIKIQKNYEEQLKDLQKKAEMEKNAAVEIERKWADLDKREAILAEREKALKEQEKIHSNIQPEDESDLIQSKDEFTFDNCITGCIEAGRISGLNFDNQYCTRTCTHFNQNESWLKLKNWRGLQNRYPSGYDLCLGPYSSPYCPVIPTYPYKKVFP